jgi:hypothetical protein
VFAFDKKKDIEKDGRTNKIELDVNIDLVRYLIYVSSILGFSKKI